MPDDLHTDVKALLERCLSHEPEQRPSSEEFYAAAIALQRSVLGDEVVRVLSPKELQVLRWVRQDQNLEDDAISDSEAVATAASKLDFFKIGKSCNFGTIKDISNGTVVFHCPSVRHYHDHRLSFSVSIQIIENHLRIPAT